MRPELSSVKTATPLEGPGEEDPGPTAQDSARGQRPEPGRRARPFSRRRPLLPWWALPSHEGYSPGSDALKLLPGKEKRFKEKNPSLCLYLLPWGSDQLYTDVIFFFFLFKKKLFKLCTAVGKLVPYLCCTVAMEVHMVLFGRNLQRSRRKSYVCMTNVKLQTTRFHTNEN